MKFGDNYNDLSREQGTNAGFQFEFYCERCNDTWRSDFSPYRSGQASGWLGKAASLFGGVLGEVGSAVEGIAESSYGRARDKAFAAALEEAKGHFRRCAKCSQYVCVRCWNTSSGLCLGCAPSAEVEIEAARAQGEVFAAGEQAALEGISRGKKLDVKRERQLVCPSCGEEARGAKFCPACGQALAVKARCPACAADVPPAARFCPECGAKA